MCLIDVSSGIGFVFGIYCDTRVPMLVGVCMGRLDIQRVSLVDGRLFSYHILGLK